MTSAWRRSCRRRFWGRDVRRLDANLVVGVGVGVVVVVAVGVPGQGVDDGFQLLKRATEPETDAKLERLP